MSPLTHLLASWLIAAKTTDNPRDCRLVAFAGILPDIDGLGLVVDIATSFTQSRQTAYYAQYHHVLWHGLFAATVSSIVFALFAKRKWRVALLVFAVFHLHLLCDLIGSRGPSPEDIWPIFYFGPFRKDPMWMWTGQWPLEGWANRTVCLILFFSAILYALRYGQSVVGIFSQRADAVFVKTLRNWRDQLLKRTV